MAVTESPRIVIGRSRRSETARPVDFVFTENMVRTNGLPEFLRAYRQEAWKIHTQTPLPTTREEAWRRTDLRQLSVGNFHLPEVGAYRKLPSVPKTLLRPHTSGGEAGQVVILPGGSQEKLDESLARQGVIFSTLRTAEKKHPELLEKIIGKIVKPSDGKFAAMAAALSQDGIFIYVPRNVVVEQPLHSLIWGPGVELAHLTHRMVFLEENSSITIVHESASPMNKEGQTLHAGISEIHVSAGANLRYVELQSWGENVWDFSHERIRVERDAKLDWIFGAVGSHLTKNFMDLDLSGPGANGRMSGFYFTNHDQHLDHDTSQNHLAPNTSSDLLFKGALLDNSRSVWQGMIYVAPGAAKTDGYQANRNLVLSPKSRADSIPGLEILADDVRCTHGATVGKIDPEQVFYLTSRGIPRLEAEQLIVGGFFDQIMQRIPFQGVQQRFQQSILEKMTTYRGDSA